MEELFTIGVSLGEIVHNRGFSRHLTNPKFIFPANKIQMFVKDYARTELEKTRERSKPIKKKKKKENI